MGSCMSRQVEVVVEDYRRANEHTNDYHYTNGNSNAKKESIPSTLRVNTSWGYTGFEIASISPMSDDGGVVKLSKSTSPLVCQTISSSSQVSTVSTF